MSVDGAYLHDGVEDDVGDALLGTDLAARAPEATDSERGRSDDGCIKMYKGR